MKIFFPSLKDTSTKTEYAISCILTQLPLSSSAPAEPAQPDSPLSFDPISRPGLRQPRYWVRCNYTQRHFGGEFTGPEIDAIAKTFKVHSGPVSPQEFGAAAEMIIRYGQGVLA